MVSLVVMAVIVLCAEWIVWRRRRRGRADAAPVTPAGMPSATLVPHAVHTPRVINLGSYTRQKADSPRQTGGVIAVRST